MNDNIQYLHHYTTIDTLALILNHRTIRFNRLDRVDDVLESNKYGELDLSRLLFVSCWTDSSEESIPLWHMYSKEMTGVRISLPFDPFDYQLLKPSPFLKGLMIKGQILSFLPVEEIFTEEYMVNVNCMFNKNTFIKRVEYVEEEILEEIQKKAVDSKVDENGKVWTTLAGPTELAGFKSIKWGFQAEVRYILLIYPTPPISQFGGLGKEWVNEVSNYFFKAIDNGYCPKKEFFDINLSQNAIDNIIVTLAPRASESDEIIVNTLLQTYTKNGKLNWSNLTNTIRQPQR